MIVGLIFYMVIIGSGNDSLNGLVVVINGVGSGVMVSVVNDIVGVCFVLKGLLGMVFVFMFLSSDFGLLNFIYLGFMM